MTPKEIVERVKTSNGYFPGATLLSAQWKSDIDHLLAIHAAVVEMFEAWQGFLFEDGVVTVSQDRLLAAFATLAALCGWTGKEGE